MHERDCTCEYCRAYANLPWVELTLRVFCPKCTKFVLLTERVHRGVQWHPTGNCPTCGFVDVFEIHVGPIGVNAEEIQ